MQTTIRIAAAAIFAVPSFAIVASYNGAFHLDGRQLALCLILAIAGAAGYLGEAGITAAARRL